MSFCLYVAARVFVQYLKWRPKDQNMIAQLQFLGSAMQALSRKNPLTESFMAQLELDLEGTGIFLGSRPSLWNTSPFCPPEKGKEARGILIDIDDAPPRKVPSEIPVNTDAVKCAPIFEIRDSQSAGQSTNNTIFHPQGPQRNSPASSSYSTFETNINITVDSAYNHLAPNDPLHFSLPNRGKDTPFQQRMAMMDQINGTAPSEIDFSTSGNSKSRSNSYKDTSSNTSFTPPDSTNNDTTHLQMGSGSITNPSLSRHSPSPPSMGTSASVAAADVMFFEVPDAAFQTFQPQLFSGPFPPGLSGTDFPMTTTTSSWAEMTDIVEDGRGSVAASSGLTPIASGEWDDMLGTGSAGNYFANR
jgi:hypothetical protein